MPAQSPSTTTQILYNSPALHALKRDQLVKLCKIHSIKANGKNVELVEKLKMHGQRLGAAPLENDDDDDDSEMGDDGTAQDIQVPLNDEVEEEEGNGTRSNSWRFQMPRPSEQWEVVMESIEEGEETASAQGTLSSLRSLATVGNGTSEFGSTGSLSRSMSSLKALATSLGLKRENTTNSAKHAKFKPDHATENAQMDGNRDELLPVKSIPYSDTSPAQPPQVDGFTFDTSPGKAKTNNPIPGASTLPGMPVPANARLSLSAFPSSSVTNAAASSSSSSSAQPTTTIRLISSTSRLSFPGTPSAASWNSSTHRNSGTPQLKPFHTTFDLDVGSPRAWPPPNHNNSTEELYPTLTASIGMDVDATPNHVPVGNNADDSDDEDVMPGGTSSWKPQPTPWGKTPIKQDPPALVLGDVFSPAPFLPTSPPTSTYTSNPNPNPNVFTFGSPHPHLNSLSNAQFRTAAQSVLEEMNARLASAGVSALSTDVLDPAKRAATLAAPLAQEKKKKKEEKAADRYGEVHERAFDRMEGIDGWAAGRRSPRDKHTDKMGLKRKSSAIDGGGGGGGGGNGAKVKVRVSGGGARRLSAGNGNGRVRPRMGRGVSGLVPSSLDDGDEEDGRGKRMKRARVEGKVSLGAVTATDAIAANETPGEESMAEEAAEAERKQKEREAIRRKLDANKARRRSSMGVNVVALKPKPKPARFGFLSSAKSLVQGVWGKAKAPTPAPAPSTTTTTTTTTTKNTPKPSSVSSSNKVSGTMGPPPARKPSISKPSVSRSSSLLKPSPSAAASSTRSRSPIPAFAAGTTGSSSSSTSRPGSSSSSRYGSKASVASSSRVSSVGTRTSTSSSSSGSGSNSRVSSLGTRSSATSVSSSSASSRVSSMGSKGALTLGGVSEEQCISGSTNSRIGNGRKMSTGSRLHAPTASSLAKSRPSSSSGNNNNSVTLTATTLKESPALVNSPRPVQPNPISAHHPFNLNSPLSKLQSPHPHPRPKAPGTIFAKPLVAPSGSGIPVPSPARLAAGGSTADASSSRKPRISRSKVIAKLASQRAAAAAGSGKVGGKVGGKKTRSSLGVGKRSSVGAGAGAGAGGMGNAAVVMSAKKRARQSEYARRRSRAGGSTGGEGGEGGGGGGMSVDA